MFAIQCTTCGARLGVNDESLVGQILACPKCGGMVLVEKPGQATPASHATPSETPPPEVDASRAPAVIPEMVVDSPLIDGHAAPPPPPAVLPDSELRTRKLLLGVLCGLVLMLLFAVGVLLTLKKDKPSPVQAPQPPETAHRKPNEAPSGPEKAVPSEPMPPVEPPIPHELPRPPENAKPAPPENEGAAGVPALNLATRVEVNTPEEADKENKRVELAELLSKTPDSLEKPAHSGDDTTETTVRSATDWLSDLERRMPGLLDPVALPPVDVSARLDMLVAELSLETTPLLTFLRIVSEWTDVPVSLEIDEFRCRGLRLDMPLAGRFENETLGGILAKLLTPLDLEPVIEDRQVQISVLPQVRDELIERRLSVADLAAGTRNPVDLRGEPDPDGPLTPQRLAEILRRLVDPVGFQTIGRLPDEEPRLQAEDDALVLRHRLRQLDRSLRLLEQIRVLRRLLQATEIVGEELAPEVFGWDKVSEPLTLNYYQPTPLAGILRQLEGATGLTILIDHRALHRALTPLASLKATVRCDRKTVNEALESLLASVDAVPLTYRIIDAKTLEITTYDAARTADRTSIEIHFYETPDRPLGPEETPEELVQTLKMTQEPMSWASPTRHDGLGDVIIDRPSGCLIVRQSQPVQRAIRLWFEKRLAGAVLEAPPVEPPLEEEP